jgi:hypothetical protein
MQEDNIWNNVEVCENRIGAQEVCEIGFALSVHGAITHTVKQW